VLVYASAFISSGLIRFPPPPIKEAKTWVEEYEIDICWVFQCGDIPL
jgi:hypothetical protein